MAKRHQPQDYASGHGGVALMDPPKPAKEELPYELEGQGEAEAVKEGAKGMPGKSDRGG